MTRFKKQKASTEFGRASQPLVAPAAPRSAATGTAGAEQLAQFYASLVGTSGERWAGSAEAPLAQEGSVETAARGAAPLNVDQAVTILPPAGPKHAQPPRPAALPEAQQRGAAPHVAIARSNVGYQLLQKAGWSEGRGIGAREQGGQAPLEPHVQQSSAGLGFVRKPLKPSAKRRTAAISAATTSADGGGGQAAPTEEPPPRALPADELSEQPVEEKVRRVRQVMQAEADEKAGKVIAKYIYGAFSDATGEPTADSNPLLRPSRALSASNPLL